MPQRKQRRDEKPHHRFRRKIGEHEPRLVSSHPEIEDEIELVGDGLDENRLKIEMPRPAAKAIVSVHGRDVRDERFPEDKAA